jgi:photosystem II stability/assembly factor-like uncharacterized protein
MQRIRTAFLTLALTAVAIPCLAQTATVTFYSIGLSAKQQVKVAVVPVGTVPFTGWLFDGNQRMAHAHRESFMTFHLAAGEHQFTVPYDSKGAGKTTLHLKVEDGGRYCIRMSARYKSGSPLVPLAFLDSQIEQVSCQQALKEAGDYKPIDVKRVDSAVRAEFESSPSFPKDN